MNEANIHRVTVRDKTGDLLFQVQLDAEDQVEHLLNFIYGFNGMTVLDREFTNLPHQPVTFEHEVFDCGWQRWRLVD